MSAISQIVAGRDWSESTRADRVRYLLETFWDGDRVHMSNVTGASRSLIGQIARGKDIHLSDKELRNIQVHVKQFSQKWLFEGKGMPFERNSSPPPPIRIRRSEEPATGSSTGSSAIVVSREIARVRTLYNRIWGNDKAAMSAATGLPVEAIDAVLTARTVPTEDFFLSLAAADTRINLDWLVTGVGDAILEPPAVPEPVLVPAPAGTSALDGLVELLGKMGQFESDLATVKQTVATVDRIAAELRELIAAKAKHETQFHKHETQLHTLNGTVGAFKEQVVALARKAVASNDAETAKASEYAQKATDLSTKALTAAQACAELIKGYVLSVKEYQDGVEALSKAVTTNDAIQDEFRAIASRFDALEQQLRAVPASGPVALPPDVTETFEKYDDRIESIRSAFKRTFEDKDSVIASLLKRVDTLEARKPVNPSALRSEVNLDGEDRLSIAEWCRLAGTHRRIVRDNSDKQVMGKRIAKVCDRFGIGLTTETPLRFPVWAMRLYVRWLASAGLTPTSEDWFEYWETNYRDETDAENLDEEFNGE